MILELHHVTAGYGKHTVLRDVSLKFSAHKMTALIGPNGCGKSTLLKAIMHFLPQQSGNIYLKCDNNKHDIASMTRKELAKRVAYLPQESTCPNYMTLGELVELSSFANRAFFKGPSDEERQRFRNVLDIVGLVDKAHLPVNTLSGGERQRAFIALVLAQNTDTILMDEPVNHLDIKYQYTILQLVRNLSRHYGKTLIVVLHDINLTSQFADDVVMMKAGAVMAQGALENVVTADNIRTVFDIEADVFYHNHRLMCQPLHGDLSIERGLVYDAAQ